MTANVILFGMDFSVYVRIARLALAEKGVRYSLQTLNPFEGKAGDGQEKQHPFRKMPVLYHGAFRVYETQAITNYINEAFPGPDLQPGNPQERAVQNQIVRICDSYLYRPLVWGLFVETVSKPLKGEAVDDTVAASAQKDVLKTFAALDPLLERHKAAGHSVSLADLHLAPMMDYGMRSVLGAAAAERFPGLVQWWRRTRTRPSMMATKSLNLPAELPEDRIPG